MVAVMVVATVVAMVVVAVVLVVVAMVVGERMVAVLVELVGVAVVAVGAAVAAIEGYGWHLEKVLWTQVLPIVWWILSLARSGSMHWSPVRTL